jgi:hypothetical protein
MSSQGRRSALTLTLHGYACEGVADLGIAAGAVPLPPSVLLLGSGLMGWRRRSRV